MHYAVKSGVQSDILDDLYGLTPIDLVSVSNDSDAKGRFEFYVFIRRRNYSIVVFICLEYLDMKRLTNGNLSSTVVGCPICKEVVSGHRFAPHLEKCMNGGKRGPSGV